VRRLPLCKLKHKLNDKLTKISFMYNEKSTKKVRIENIEEAKLYFKSMGCNHFHLDREDYDMADQYYAQNISSEMEDLWRQEEFDLVFNEFSYKNDKKEIWIYYSSLNKLKKLNDYHFERILYVTKKILDVLPKNQIRLVLYTIIGNNSTKTHGGLIEDFARFGRLDLLKEIVNIAYDLLEIAYQENLEVGFSRGYFVDVIEELNIDHFGIDIKKLRKLDMIENSCYYLKKAKEGN